MKVTRSYVALLALIAPTARFSAKVGDLIRQMHEHDLFTAEVTRADTHVWNQEIPALLAAKGFRVDKPVSVIKGEYLDLTEYGKTFLDRLLLQVVRPAQP